MGEKEYLGDGVYADVENGMIKLTTEDGIRATNTIYLELPVFESLVRYVSAKRQASPSESEGPK